MKPEDVPLLFTDLASTYEAIIGQPSDSEIFKIRDRVYEVRYQISYDEEKGICNLVSLIQDKESYTAEYTSAFTSPKKPRIYNSSIVEAIKDAVRAQKRPSTRRNARIMPSSRRQSGEPATSS